jgi:Uma2 family endonuclease
MATILAETVTPDMVVSFQIRPGTYPQFRDARGDQKRPLLKCYRGSVTLVSPGKSHETASRRLLSLILAICLELRIKHTALGSTTAELPKGFKDTGYEPDESYYIQSQGHAVEGQAPDLAIEVVVTHSEEKALLAGALIGIPEIWVLNIPRRQMTFYHLIRRGKQEGTYQPRQKSRAFPFLMASDVLERLDDPESDDTVFHENCRAWARRVLVTRRRKREDRHGRASEGE